MLLQLHRSRENYEDEKPGFWEVVAYKTLWSVACWFESKLNCFPRFGHSGGQMKLRGFEPDLQVNWVWLWDSSVLICAKTANSANAESFCQLWRTEGHWPEFRILCSATVCLFNVCRCAWSFWLPDRNSEPWAISNRKQCGWPKHKHYYKQRGFNTPALHFFFRKCDTQLLLDVGEDHRDRYAGCWYEIPICTAAKRTLSVGHQVWRVAILWWWHRWNGNTSPPKGELPSWHQKLQFSFFSALSQTEVAN